MLIRAINWCLRDIHLIAQTAAKIRAGATDSPNEAWYADANYTMIITMFLTVMIGMRGEAVEGLVVSWLTASPPSACYSVAYMNTEW